jgi:hypothetical protein
MLKSIYRWAWTRNQVLFKVGRSALERLDSAGIDALLLKGAALVHLDYQDAGVRPMADLDVLVRPDDVEDAVAVLGSLGWTSRSSRSPSRLAALYADDLRNGLGQGLDLHWRILMSPEPEHDLWREAVPLTLAGAETRALSAADRLLHVCAHGLVPNDPPAIRWVADAATITRRHEIDWARLVDQARRRQVSLSVGRALAYLTRAIEAPVPSQVVEELNRGPHSRVEIAAYNAAMAPVSLYEVVRWHWCRYRRVEPRRLQAAMGFPGYLRMLLGYDRRRSFALHVARRLGVGAQRTISRRPLTYRP